MKLTLIIALTAAATFAQGPLTPPGAPAPTGKSLQEIYDKAEAADAKAEKRTPISSAPYVITEPGSYYLTTNITRGSLTSVAITVQAQARDVTIDLNGFTVIGDVASSAERTTVRNGTVASLMGVIAGNRASVSGLNLVGAGIQTGDFSSVSNCKVLLNTSLTAILTGVSSIVEGCTVELVTTGSAVTAISMGFNALVKNCRVKGHSKVEHDGIRIASGSICDTGVEGCRVGISGTEAGTSVSNVSVFYTASGIQLRDDSTLNNVTVRQCDATAIDVGARSVVTRINVTQAMNGLRVAEECRISESVVSVCPLSGIRAGSGSSISNCVVSQMGDAGIHVGNGASVSGCVMRLNEIGIRIGAQTSVTGCSFDLNGSGISSEGAVDGSRIESNQFTHNTTAITLLAAGNTILKNAFRGNGFNISCPPGNDIAPASSAATATSPVANIVY